MIAYTSTLTWDEVVWVIRRVLGFDDALNQGAKLLSFPNLIFVEVDKLVVARAQKLLEEYGLRPRGAIHVASALKKGVKEIVSDDKDLDKVKEMERIPL